MNVSEYNQIAESLFSTIRQKRVAHAYLFLGTGVNKETIAFIFAQSLLCSRPIKGEACKKCEDCLLVERGVHPDLWVVSPEGAYIKIEQVREVQRKAAYKPYRAGRQVFLFKEADTMTPEAANCLLRILEEPPGQVLFILLANYYYALLPTVVSRCHQFTFSESLEQGISLKGSELLKAEEVLALISRLSKMNIYESLKLAEKFIGGEFGAHACLEMMALWYRDLLIWKLTGMGELLFHPDRVTEISEVSKQYQARRLVRDLWKIEEAKKQLVARGNIRLTLEVLFLSLSMDD